MDKNHEHLAGDLEWVEERLRADRASADPLQLDQVKRRVMARYESRQRRSMSVKSRLATILTVFGLVGGTGGALAIAGGGLGGLIHHSAASGQYCPSKGEPDQNGDVHSNCHTGSKGRGAGGEDKSGKTDKGFNKLLHH